jgi:hypothetical protein
VVVVLFLACAFIQQVTAEAMPALRYAKYLLPVVALGITAPLVRQVAPSRFARRDLRDFVALAMVVIAASIALAMLRHAPVARALEEAALVMAPLITACVIFPSLRVERSSTYADWIFAGTAATYLVERGGAIAGVVSRPGGIWDRLLTSSSAAESTASFVFGLMALYYVYTGRRTRALLAIALVILSFKRIAMFGALTCILLWVLLRVTRVDLRRHWRLVAALAVLANALVLLVLYWLSTGSLNELIDRHTGLSTDWFTMGRGSLYAALFARFEPGWLGHGLGAATSYLEAVGFTAQNAHSDVIKYVIEVGPLLATAWLWALYRLARGSTAALLLVVFANILFISDNVSIYFELMFVLYVLIGFLSVRDPAASLGEARG